MKFPIIIDDKKKIRLKYIIGFSILIVIIEGIFFYPEDENNLKIILLFGIPGSIWMLALFSLNFIKSFKIIGYIEFKDNTLLINENKIELENIKIIKITYQNYYGQWIRMYVTQGNTNEIFILLKNRKQIRLRIFLENRNSYELLKRFAAKLIEKGVKVKYFKDHTQIYPKNKSI